VLQDVANPFSSALHRAIEDVGVQRGLLVLAGSSDEEPERERELLGVLRARRVDGIIVVPTGAPDEELAAAHRDGTPIVCVDRASPVPGVDTVTADNRGGVAAAVRALHALGHRRIGFVADRASLWTASERLEGFTRAMAELGCRTRPAWVRLDVHTADAAQRTVTQLLAPASTPASTSASSSGPAPGPTAIITAQNWLTIGARRALVELGLHRVIAHVGFDDFPLADMLDPPVSVIAQDPAEMGRQAARLLLSHLDEPHRPPQSATLPTRYIPRGSGELRPPSH
jgi:LacI family transcriptional regulator